MRTTKVRHSDATATAETSLSASEAVAETPASTTNASVVHDTLSATTGGNYNNTSNGHTSVLVPSSVSTATTVGGKAGRSMSSFHGSALSFHSLDYFVKVPAPGRRFCSCGTVDKQILHNVSGIFRPGMNAIMGPTGSGKTTLLDVLAGRTETHGIRGQILVDGQPTPENFKCMTGYVVQDDVVMGTLTVRENIMFSANLRISSSVSHEEKCQRVDDAIQELGLLACADTKVIDHAMDTFPPYSEAILSVGSQFVRGVSGGERKRTNIGMELVISPAVLYLDEPTTGLDANTAFYVIALLQRLSRRGRTIIFSIHQPRYTIFRLFDRLSLMAHGRTVYHGVSDEALDYFQSIGYLCEEHNNPPDFFLDVIRGESTVVCNVVNEDSTIAESVFVDPPVDYDEDDDADKKPNTVHTSQTLLAEVLANRFTVSTWAQRMDNELATIFSEFELQKQSGTLKRVRCCQYSTSFLTQLRYVSKRTIVNIIRNPEASAMQLAFAIFFAVVMGIIFLQLDDSYPSGLQNRIGSLFFIVAVLMFQNWSGIELFLQERIVFVHESASGFYLTSAYFFSKILCDFVPMRLVPLCAFSVIAYFMIGYQIDAAKFFIFFLDLFLTTMGAAAICFFFGATVGVYAIANLLVVLVFILMSIFGGLVVNIENLEDWLSWLQYLSMIRYSLNVLLITEMHDMTFYTTVNGTKIPAMTGAQYLTSQGIKHETAWDFWQNIMALAIMAVVIMILAYIQLRRIKKLK